MMQSNCINDTFIMAFNNADMIKKLVASPLLFLNDYHNVDLFTIEKMLRGEEYVIEEIKDENGEDNDLPQVEPSMNVPIEVLADEDEIPF